MHARLKQLNVTAAGADLRREEWRRAAPAQLGGDVALGLSHLIV
jgi:hypothetical protein